MSRKGGKANGAATLLIVATLLWVPSALADGSSGAFTTSGPVRFPADSQATFDPEAFFINDTAALGAVTAIFPSVSACVFETRSAEIQVASEPLFWTPYTMREACYTLTDARLSLVAGDQAGWMGLHVKRGGTLPLHVGYPMELISSAASTLASTEGDIATARAQDEPSDPYFVHQIARDHLRASEAGRIVFEGGGSLKVKGLDFRIESAENTTTYRTEDSAPSAPAHAERVRRWVTLDFESGRVEVEAGAPVQIVANNARVESDGRVSFSAVSGSLRLRGEDHAAARGEQVTLEGHFSSDVRPAPGAGGQGVLVELEGEARSVSIGAARVAAPAAVGDSPSWGLLLIGAAVVSAGAAAALLLHHHRQHGHKPATWADLATEAADAGRFDEADAFMRKALEEDPQNAELAGELGLALLAQGRFHAAIEAFGKATRLLKNGVPERWMAIAAVNAGDLEQAEIYLLLAIHLASDKRELAEIETTPAFDALRCLPSVRTEMAEAIERLFGGESAEAEGAEP